MGVFRCFTAAAQGAQAAKFTQLPVWFLSIGQKSRTQPEPRRSACGTSFLYVKRPDLVSTYLSETAVWQGKAPPPAG